MFAKILFAQRTQRAQRNNTKESPPRTLSPRPLRLCARLFPPVGPLGFNAKTQRPKGAKVGGGNGCLANDERLVAWTEIFFASLHCNVGEVCIFGKTFSPRSLHCNPSESRMIARIFFAQRTRRARSNNGKGDPPRTLSPRPLRLRAQVPSGTVLVAACRARPWNLTFGTRCFEQEKTERTEHRWTWSISPFPLWPPVQIVCLVAADRAASLQCNVGEVCIFGKTFSPRSLRLCANTGPRGFWLRLAALRLCVEVLTVLLHGSGLGLVAFAFPAVCPH
jgi:hypothetical protein